MPEAAEVVDMFLHLAVDQQTGGGGNGSPRTGSGSNGTNGLGGRREWASMVPLLMVLADQVL